MSLRRRFYLWRLTRAYRSIALLEPHCGIDGLTLRGEFAVETFHMMDEEQTALGWGRQQRRTWKRRMLGHA
jgi:hypothetical protein